MEEAEDVVFFEAFAAAEEVEFDDEGEAGDLDFLKGRAKFPEYDVFSLMHYDE